MPSASFITSAWERAEAGSGVRSGFSPEGSTAMGDKKSNPGLSRAGLEIIERMHGEGPVKNVLVTLAELHEQGVINLDVSVKKVLDTVSSLEPRIAPQILVCNSTHYFFIVAPEPDPPEPD
jgi:hypothetical protein